MTDTLGSPSGDEEHPADINAQITKNVQDMIRSSADATIKSWKHGMSRTLREYRREMRGFENRLASRWQKPFDLYQLLLLASMELGNTVIHDYGQREEAKTDKVFETLVLLHVRACYASSATLALLRSGHADSADALWRTLHELAVVAWLLKDHEPELAERYREFEHVEVWRNARAYQAVQGRLRKNAGGGYEPIPKKEFEQLRDNFQRLKAKYGDRYVNEEYGWAANLLPEDKRVSLDAIERLVGLDHLRPFYKSGNLTAHAPARSLSLSVARRGQEAFLRPGPSNAGLASAGQGAMISLTQITVVLLQYAFDKVDDPLNDPSLIVAMQVLQDLSAEACNAFAEAEDRLEEDEAKLWQPNDESVSSAGLLDKLRDLLNRSRG